ncbi:MAG: hypothetical protein KDA95_06520 [Acidimicrobiales bacterium]|nr:hypothetical protein [Acidimicrobiales bacterium]
MPSITIRDLPDYVRDEIASRAARSGRSMQEYLRMELIELAARPDIELLASQIVDRKRRAATSLTSEQILDYLDSDRR